MKKYESYRIMYLISAIILIALSIALSYDSYKYKEYYSTPIHVIYGIRFLEFGIPSLIFYLIGRKLRKDDNERKNKK